MRRLCLAPSLAAAAATATSLLYSRLHRHRLPCRRLRRRWLFPRRARGVRRVDGVALKGAVRCPARSHRQPPPPRHRARPKPRPRPSTPTAIKSAPSVADAVGTRPANTPPTARTESAVVPRRQTTPTRRQLHGPDKPSFFPLLWAPCFLLYIFLHINNISSFFCIFYIFDRVQWARVIRASPISHRRPQTFGRPIILAGPPWSAMATFWSQTMGATRKCAPSSVKKGDKTTHGANRGRKTDGAAPRCRAREPAFSHLAPVDAVGCSETRASTFPFFSPFAFVLFIPFDFFPKAALSRSTGQSGDYDGDA